MSCETHDFIGKLSVSTVQDSFAELFAALGLEEARRPSPIDDDPCAAADR